MFVIPMAGLSSRFFKEGFIKPKYQLELNGESVFSWSIKSFDKYFKTDFFVFIYRDIYGTKDFLYQEIKRLEIKNYQLVELKNETLGQADTVFQGLLQVDDNNDELYIFNIDSKIIEFSKPSWVVKCSGFLEVFKGEGDHWSFAKPKEGTQEVLQTEEKERISDLCSDGLYYFRKRSIFNMLFLNAKNKNQTTKNEYYIAPLYNDLISQKKIVYYNLIPTGNILFCGTPQEYRNLLKKDL